MNFKAKEFSIFMKAFLPVIKVKYFFVNKFTHNFVYCELECLSKSINCEVLFVIELVNELYY
jgi:hypothetical protein